LEPSGNEAELAQGVFDGKVFNFWKNISIAGGFLFLLASGAGKYSLDAKK
jgi:uncharacterized membrane protein YphA (DoxX/SURF4 family)